MTPYVGVKAMTPGTLHHIQGKKETTFTYYDILRDIDPARIVGSEAISFENQFEQFESCFTESIKMHMISEAPLATMCSGGLDSSLVTAFAKDVSPDIVSYVADVEGLHGQEVIRAKTVAKALNVELRQVKVDTEAYYRAFSNAILANDQPLYFSQDIAAMVVAKAICSDGFKVVLTGDGADEVFGGYDWYARTYCDWRRQRLRARWIPNTSLTRAIGRLVPHLKPCNLKQLEHSHIRLEGPDKTGVNPINVLLVEGAHRYLREARLFRKLNALKLHEDRAFLAKSFEDIYVHMREKLASLDKMTMHHSIEARIPFLENQLFDFGLHLPLNMKYHRSIMKRMIRHLAEKRLPGKVVQLPKIGFRIAPSMWSDITDFLRNGRVAELLKWHSHDQQDILDLLHKHRYLEFRLLSTELWLRMRFDGESPDKLSDTLLELKYRKAQPS